MPPAIDRRRAHTVPVHPATRKHRRQVLSWALANGHPVDRDALAVVTAIRSHPINGQPRLEWSVDQVGRLLEAHAPAWCRSHQVAEPSNVAATLRTYLRWLSANGKLAVGSDRTADLGRAIADYCTGPHGGRSRHPASQLAPVLPIC